MLVMKDVHSQQLKEVMQVQNALGVRFSVRRCVVEVARLLVVQLTRWVTEMQTVPQAAIRREVCAETDLERQERKAEVPSMYVANAEPVILDDAKRSHA